MTREAFAQEFERSRHALWVVAAALLTDRTEAEDIVQEAAAVALSKLEQFETGTSFLAWMSQIVRNLASNLRHKTHRRRTHATDSQTLDLVRTSPSIPADSSSSLGISTFGQLLKDQGSFDDTVVRALAHLDDNARACLLLRSVCGLSYREISAMLDLPEGTAMSHVHRARRCVREHIEAASLSQTDSSSDVVVPGHRSTVAGGGGGGGIGGGMGGSGTS